MRSAIAIGLGMLVPAVMAAEHVSDDVLRRFVEQSRKVSTQLIQQIGGEMRKEVEATGRLRAVMVCKYTAPEVASSISRMNGMRVSRVSLKPRNPALGYPDPWEQNVLVEFERRAGEGEKTDAMEFAEAVSEPTGNLPALHEGDTAGRCASLPRSGRTDVGGRQGADRQRVPHDRAVGFAEDRSVVLSRSRSHCRRGSVLRACRHAAGVQRLT